MKVELSKRLRSIVRELAARAYERDLRKLLRPLAQSFRQWEAGQTDTWSLLGAIDRLANPRRRLAERYETNDIAPMMVAYAIVTGLLREDEVPAEIRNALERAIVFYRQGIADGSVGVSLEEED
jgi:hypothetical protein